MVTNLIPLGAASLSFVCGLLLEVGDLTSVDCGGCSASAYATLDNGAQWTDPNVVQTVTGGTMTITNITETPGECTCIYERADENSEWKLVVGCHEKKGCDALITVQFVPASSTFHVDVDGAEWPAGQTVDVTASYSKCDGTAGQSKEAKFEYPFGTDAGGCTVTASCLKCNTTCPAPPAN